ncbi:unnamed protein product, partial [marine sediment metagenome]
HSAEGARQRDVVFKRGEQKAQNEANVATLFGMADVLAKNLGPSAQDFIQRPGDKAAMLKSYQEINPDVVDISVDPNSASFFIQEKDKAGKIFTKQLTAEDLENEATRLSPGKFKSVLDARAAAIRGPRTRAQELAESREARAGRGEKRSIKAGGLAKKQAGRKRVEDIQDEIFKIETPAKGFARQSEFDQGEQLLNRIARSDADSEILSDTAEGMITRRSALINVINKEILDRKGFARGKPVATAKEAAELKQIQDSISRIENIQSRAQRPTGLAAAGQVSQGQGGLGGTAQADDQNIATPQTQAELDSLPTGALFRKPNDDKLYRK